MNGLACARAAALLGQRAQGLSAAEALHLEAHLEGCQACTEQAALLGGLRALTDRLPTALTHAGRERAVAGALAQAQAQVSGAHAGAAGSSWSAARAGRAVHAAIKGQRRTWQLAAGAGALAVSAAALVLGLRAATPANGLPAGVRVLHGSVEIGSQQHGASAARSAVTTLRAKGPATVTLAHATVELRKGTTLRWDGAARRVELQAGSVVADVDRDAHQPFSVRTARFTVLVLGTRFEVSADAVAVERGQVRVLANDGTPLVDSLAAGERYSPGTSVPAAAVAPAVGAGRAAPVAPMVVPPVVPQVELAAHAHQGAATGSTPQVTKLLAQARTQLASGHAENARGSVEAALVHARTPSDRAEALSLRAECALVDGNLGAAVAGYLRVSRTFAQLPAGQNALFAAARLEDQRGQRAKSAELLKRYLSHYPNGRFVREARQRLGVASESAESAASAP